MLRCPKCGENATKNGNKNGIQQYQCSKRKTDSCDWQGFFPVGLEDDRMVGIPTDAVNELHAKIVSGKSARYVITSAQNATPVWQPFFKNLMSYCGHMAAQLIVIPYRYKNPTSMWSEKAKDDDWWAPELHPFIYDQRVDLNPNLILLADIKTQPTASDPLTGFETLTGANSAIVGHPQLALKTIPTPQHRLPKILLSTGAVTKANYIQAKAGKKAEHHHAFAALVVEIDGDTFHVRQLNATRSGSFCDLDREYRPGKLPREVRAEALIMGDTHVDFADPDAVEATFGSHNCVVDVLNPKYLVWHDVLDFYSRMHHHQGQFFVNYAKHFSNRTNVEAEVDRCFEFIDFHTPEQAKNIFVYSNHPDMFARWINGTDPRSDPENAVFWAKTFAAMCEGTRMTPTGTATIDPFAYWAKKKLKCYGKSRFLAPDESCQIKGIEVGYHGHFGPGGARGTLKAFTKIGAKSVIGHSHVPGIDKGAYQVGTTSKLKAEYVKGPHAWLHTHCVIYPNGKRSLVNIINGKWRLEP